MLQGGDGGTGDGYPVHVQTVRGADDSVVLRPVEVVELAISKTDIKALCRVDRVRDHAGGAHVTLGVGGELNTHHDPDLPCRVVQVVHGLVGQGSVCLPVATDITLGRCHAVGVGVEAFTTI